MESNQTHIFSLSGKPKYRYIFLVFFVLSFILMLVLQNNYYNNYYSSKHLEMLEETIHQKQQLLGTLFSSLDSAFIEEDPENLLNSRTPEFERLVGEEGISLFFYKKGSLVYWSDHTVDLPAKWHSRFDTPVYYTPTAIYLTVMHQTDQGILFGLVLIRTTFPYENEYLKSSYFKDYKINPEVKIYADKNETLSVVNGINGEYLFSIDLYSNLIRNTLNVKLSFFLLVLAIISLFAFFALENDLKRSVFGRTVWFIVSILVMIIVFFIVIFREFPGIVFESNLFSPEVFANDYFSSLGQLWILVMVVLMISALYYWFFNRSKMLNQKGENIVAIITVFIATAWFILLHSISHSLVIDSTISFEVYKLNTISVYTLIGVLILIMGVLAFCLMIDRAFHTMSLPRKQWNYVVYFSGTILLVGFLIACPDLFENVLIVFYVILISSLVFLRFNKRRKRIRFGRFMPLLLAVSIFMTIDTQDHTQEKKQAQMEVELAKLSSEQDAVAEMLFADLSARLRTDSLLIRRLSYQIINDGRVLDYLQRNYFSGYWTKYDLRISICRPDDDVFLEPPVGQWLPCFPFFEQLVIDEGISVDNSDFYFLNNLNGRISYVAEIPYQTITGDISIFIELDSKIISEELGYPTLLLKENAQKDQSISFAKYNNGMLVNSGGEFIYRASPTYYMDILQEANFAEIDGYMHAYSQVDDENIVIVTTPVVLPSDKLISFSYIFTLIFVIFSILYLLATASHLRANVTWDFKNKIQYSLVGVLFMTFLFICSGTIYFVKQQYEVKHQDNLHTAMRSLYIELIHKVEFEDNLRNWSSENYYNMDELLRKFSNVFYTDINLYDPNGFLLATSRSEIFRQRLLSNRMERVAYQKMANDDYSSFIQTERIGNMTYQSAYVPLLNSENKRLAYLNLPYFTQPEVLAQELTNLVVAIINMYVFLMLLILFLSVLIADRITQPLRFVQQRIARLSLSKSNEKIIYKGKDEIAGLVEEYNMMVDELDRSAQLLAQSERESAWREMAKQIAHEIKNPLTPMKLNVQHMQRMVALEPDNIQEKIDKVSQTLIEQIDSLSLIANEFSDFAKMPKARRKKVDLFSTLQKVVQLFEGNQGAAISLDADAVKNMHVFADSEQLQRVFINLIKNGIQAVPEGREKKIIITASVEDEMLVVAVNDNGKGVPEEIRDKLFQPNFTTKSSGMGMGLAITANIIKSLNGKIWFNTQHGEGTTFYVSIPKD